MDTATSQWQYPESSIAVVGMSCRFPGAGDPEEYWNTILTGRSMCEKLSPNRIDLDKFRRALNGSGKSDKNFYGNFLEDLKGFDNDFFNFKSKMAASQDPQQRLLLEASFQAMDSFGYFNLPEHEREDNVGVYIGAASGDYTEHHQAHPPTSYSAVGQLRAFLTGRISHQFGWTGESFTVDTACSSSAVAISQACKAVETGQCALALAGGVNTITSPQLWLDLACGGFLSQSGPSKSFDDSADGYCRGEGVGLVVLKRLDMAQRDGDDILGVIVGASVNQGGKSKQIHVPDSSAQAALYRTILRQSSLDSNSVTYIETHGTGTQKGDPIEVSSVREVFGSRSRQHQAYLGSVKANIGHTEAASGSASLIKAILMVQEGQIPIQTNFSSLNRNIDALEPDGLAISRASQSWDASFRAMCVNNYGAAGANAAFIVCQPPVATEQQVKKHTSDDSFPIIISGASLSSLKENINAVRRSLCVKSGRYSLADVSYTLSRKRCRHRYLWTTSATSTASLCESLDKSSNFTARPKETPGVVLVFSGHSKRTVSIPRHLYEQVPLLQKHILECENEMKVLGLDGLGSWIFDEAKIPDVISLQCGMFAIQYAFAKLWIDCGVEVQAVVGHSFGELTALCISGVLSLKDAVALIYGRARLIKEEWGKESGCMISLQGTLEDVQDLMSKMPKDTSVEIACYNAPELKVLVGTKAEINTVEELATASGLNPRRLEISHGYHSKLTDPLLPGLDYLSESISFKKPVIPLETATKSHVDVVSPDHISKHMRQPVYFRDAVSRIEAQQRPMIWLEAGFGSGVMTLVQKSLTHQGTSQVISVNDRRQSALESLSTVTQTLWRAGSNVKWANFHSLIGLRPRNLHLLAPYQFDHSKEHWIDLVDRSLGLSTDPASVQANNVPTPNLVTRLNESDSAGQLKFAVDTSSEYYNSILRGHSVVTHPLCPASLYVELVAGAIKSLTSQSNDVGFNFSNLEILVPLGLASGTTVMVNLTPDSDGAYAYVVESAQTDQNSRERRPKVHAKGKAFLYDTKCVPKSPLDVYDRLMSGRPEALEADSKKETLKTNTIYRLFSRVVDYSAALKGIHQLSFVGNEAIAKVDMSACPPIERNDEIACDPRLLDNLLQVVGLLINSSDKCPFDSVYVASAIETIEVCNASRLERSNVWSVYARYAETKDGKKVIGDVFASCGDNRDLQVALLGVQFSKQQLNRLRDILQSCNSGHLSDNAIYTRTIPQNLKFTKAVPEPSANKPQTARSQESTKRARRDIESLLLGPLESIVGISPDSIEAGSTLEQHGLDSMGGSELCNEIHNLFKIECTPDELSPLDYSGLISFIAEKKYGPGHGMELQEDDNDTSSASKLSFESLKSSTRRTNSSDSFEMVTTPDTDHFASFGKEKTEVSAETFPAVLGDPLSLLNEITALYPQFAKDHKFTSFCTVVEPRQDELVVKYIIDALQKLGLDLDALPAVATVPDIKTFLPSQKQESYSRLVNRFEAILVDSGLVEKTSDGLIRTRSKIPSSTAGQLYERLIDDFPQHEKEFRLLALTGPILADFLTGERSPVKVLFGDPRALDLMSKVYADAPIFATLNTMLLELIDRVLGVDTSGPVRILEVGAGTGGTTTRLAELLEKTGRPCEYVFTDVGARFVKNAETTFAKYPWMTFQVLDLEKDISADLKDKYDIVIATNVVHATKDVLQSLQKMGSLLNEKGCMILSELTTKSKWYDAVWGVLDGWWSFNDGRNHAIMDDNEWKSTMMKAGFQAVATSKGETQESRMQELIVGTKSQIVRPSGTGFRWSKLNHDSDRETLEYKNVEGLSLKAEVWWPKDKKPRGPMPIALIVHGGGHIMLERTCIRPKQTYYLLKSGILPVSIDYRLAPETNLIDGAMTDTRDAVSWLRTTFPSIASTRGFPVNPTKLIALGYSTGGHLALTTAHTCPAASIPPPLAILAFYPPTDYLSSHWKTSQSQYPDPILTPAQLSHLISSSNPLSRYPCPLAHNPQHGCVAPADPRSNLLISSLKHANTVPFLLNESISPTNPQPYPPPHLIEAISPIIQARAGLHKTPTYLIHSADDDLLPIKFSEEFVAALKGQGVRAELKSVPFGGHDSFDLYTAPGTEEWELYIQGGFDFLFQHLNVEDGQG
ncbi:MAG: hypothetical protein Q9227_008483 [Pyrenula ochraceoflavens]